MVFKSETIYNENEGAKLLRAEILNIIDEQIFSAGLDPVASSLGFIEEMVELRDGKYTTMLGTNDLEEIGEFDEFAIINKEQGYEKGYELKRFGGKVAISKPLRKWIEVYNGSEKISPSVKTEITKLTRDVQRLVNAAKLTKNNLSTKILTEGFVATNAYGAGSASPDGVALFSASHVIKSTGDLQSNLQAGALTQTTLAAAIEKLRNMKDGMGRKMRRASVYSLIVSSENEANARKILNDGSNFAAALSDTETNNSVTSNIFQWDGFRVELLVLDTLNQPSVSWTVGTATAWFLLNKTAASEMEAFRFLTLFNDEVDMYEDKATKVLYVDIDLSATTDHYQSEVIVWSTWV